MCVAENEQVSTLATSDYDFHDGTLITSCQLHSDGESIQVERGRVRERVSKVTSEEESERGDG